MKLISQELLQQLKQQVLAMADDIVAPPEPLMVFSQRPMSTSQRVAMIRQAAA